MGAISLQEFMGMGSISLENFFQSDKQIYKLKQFSLSKTSAGLSNLVSHNAGLSFHQIKFIRSLRPGESFFITGIEFTDPDNNVHRAVSRQVFIMK